MSAQQDKFDRDLWRKRQIVKENGVWTVEGRPRTTYKLLSIQTPSNIPGKSVVTILITYPPGAATPPHSHNGAAVFGQVVKGEIVNQMIHPRSNTEAGTTTGTGEHDSGVGVYTSGEMWYEAPGCHHVRSENGGGEEGQAFATFIIETAKLEAVENPVAALTILDVDLEEGKRP